MRLAWGPPRRRTGIVAVLSVIVPLSASACSGAPAAPATSATSAAATAATTPKVPRATAAGGFTVSGVRPVPANGSQDSVTGGGVRENGIYLGTLTYVIRDSYGFPFDDTLGGFGPPMRYLQTVCGAPQHAGGAHWFPDTVTVTVPFDQPA
jgi:hypothetical protein